MEGTVYLYTARQYQTYVKCTNIYVRGNGTLEFTDEKTIQHVFRGDWEVKII